MDEEEEEDGTWKDWVTACLMKVDTAVRGLWKQLEKMERGMEEWRRLEDQQWEWVTRLLMEVKQQMDRVKAEREEEEEGDKEESPVEGEKKGGVESREVEDDEVESLEKDGEAKEGVMEEDKKAEDEEMGSDKDPNRDGETVNEPETEGKKSGEDVEME